MDRQWQHPNERVARQLRHLGCRVGTAAEALGASLGSGQRVFAATACGKSAPWSRRWWRRPRACPPSR